MKKFFISIALATLCSSSFSLGVVRAVPPSTNSEVELLIGYSAGVLNRFPGLSCPKNFIIPLLSDVPKSVFNTGGRLSKFLPMSTSLHNEYSRRLGLAQQNKTCNVGNSDYMLSVDGLLTMFGGTEQNVLFARGFVMSAHDMRVLSQCSENSPVEDIDKFFTEVTNGLLLAKRNNNGGAPANQVLEALFSTMNVNYKCI